MYKILSNVSDFILTLKTVTWPTDREMEETKKHYFNKHGIPNVIGCIDGTHIRIDRLMFSESSYYNCKDFFSLQAQIVCDHNLRIIHYHVGFPGSVHDARVFSHSEIS